MMRPYPFPLGRWLALMAFVALPSFSRADGGDDDPPPAPVNTCKGSQVYDADKGTCVDVQNSSLTRDEIFFAVRQLAYAGRYRDAQKLTEALPERDPGRLTYLGFTHRRLGNLERSMIFYQQAIDQDPGNILARSYMGQGLVEAGDISAALVQLHQIRAHGGRGSWSEISLQSAIETGGTYNH